MNVFDLKKLYLKLNMRRFAGWTVCICVLVSSIFFHGFISPETAKNAVPTEENNQLEQLLAQNEKYNIMIAVDTSLPEEEVYSVLLNETGKETTKASLEALNVPVVTAAEEYIWDTKAMANVQEQVNIRKEAAEDSQVVGRLRKGNAADILEMGTEWTLIQSGKVTGYVKNEFLLFGEQAEILANELGTVTAIVSGEGVFVRETANESANVLEQVDTGKEYICGEEENGWIPVVVGSGKIGYIRSEFASVDLRLGSAISIEEEMAAKKAAEEAKRKAAEEARKKAAAQAKKKAVAEAVTTKRAETQSSVDDVALIAAMVEVEAGSNYDGCLAVANVILNRMKSSKFPSSASGVIYQRGQFPGAHNGKLARVLARGANGTCVAAVQAAFAGNNNVGERLYFNMVRAINFNKVSNYVVIGGNCFY